MNTRRNKYSKQEVTKSNNVKDEPKKRERSREQEIPKKTKAAVKIEDVKKDQADLTEVYKISIVSAFKVLLENFVEKEIDQM